MSLLTPIPQRVAAATAVATAITTAQAAQTAFAAKLDDLVDLLHPDEKIAALEAVIRSETDVAAIQEAQNQIAQVSANKDLARETAIGLARPTQSALYASLTALLTAALTEMNNLATEAQTAENAVFSAYGLPWEATAVTRRVNTYKAQLQGMLTSLQSDLNRAGNLQLSRSAGTSILNWFS